MMAGSNELQVADHDTDSKKKSKSKSKSKMTGGAL